LQKISLQQIILSSFCYDFFARKLGEGISSFSDALETFNKSRSYNLLASLHLKNNGSHSSLEVLTWINYPEQQRVENATKIMLPMLQCHTSNDCHILIGKIYFFEVEISIRNASRNKINW